MESIWSPSGVSGLYQDFIRTPDGVHQEFIGKLIQYGAYDMCPGPVFQCEFNGGVHFVNKLTIFGNFFVLYVCIHIIHHFSV